MNRLFSRLTLALIVFVLAGCGSFNPPDGPAATVDSGVIGVTPSPTTPQGQIPVSPQRLRVWVPPEFSPLEDTPAGELLRSRLEEFTTRYPGMQIEVRVKSTSGESSLLASLTSTLAAAPLALPDLVALPPHDLEAAAIKGLIYPLETDYTNDDWYNFAIASATIQGSLYGLPFAGDCLVMVYRTDHVEIPPADWQTALEIAGPLAFPANEPEGLVPLAFYLSAGGTHAGDDGRPTLQFQPLLKTLTFLEQAQSVNIMPYWLAQYDRDEHAWQAYRENRATLVITWISNYLKILPSSSALAPIPTYDGTKISLAKNWVWVLASPDAGKRALAEELAAFLTQPDFLAEWTLAAGYLPVRAEALAGWPPSSRQTFAKRLMPSILPAPPREITFLLGPILQQAAVDVLRQQATAQEAAQQALDTLSLP